MSDRAHTSALIRRIAGERRRTLVPLAVAFVLNVLAYAFLVYPLSERVANVEQRNAMAEQALAAAKQDYGQASGTLTGKARAGTELETFYRSVLPADLAGARRLTHLRLAQLARQSNLRYAHASAEPIEAKGSTLTRLQIKLELAGTYGDMRSFIHALETAPEFVVIDNVALAEDTESENRLTVNLELSTYYRTPAP
jgi:Tfp pilus assembly protein PilO